MQHYYFWFLERFYFSKLRLVTQVFITYKPVYWFAEKRLFYHIWTCLLICKKKIVFYVIKICQIWKFSYIFKWKFRILDHDNSWVNHLYVKSKLIFNVFYCFTNFTGIQPENSHDQECEIFRVVFLYKHKHIENFQICTMYL